MVGSWFGRLMYSARISPVIGTFTAPSAGLTARMLAAAMVAASPPCWARRTMTNPPTVSAKASTRRAPASCMNQDFIRPNNGGTLEKVRQALAQQLHPAGVVVGGKELPHAGLGQRDQVLDRLPVALHRLADDEPHRLSQPESLGAGQRDR